MFFLELFKGQIAWNESNGNLILLLWMMVTVKGEGKGDDLFLCRVSGFLWWCMWWQDNLKGMPQSNRHRKVSIFFHWNYWFNKSFTVGTVLSFLPSSSKTNHLYCLMHAMNLIVLQFESFIATLAFYRQLLTWIRFYLFLSRSSGLSSCCFWLIGVSWCRSNGLRW